MQKLTIIATKGSLDWAYPPFILASTAAALDIKVVMFFTFYGLKLLLKDVDNLKVSPMGNPAMPMKMPFGPKWLRKIDFAPKIPNAMWSVPGMEALATSLMKKTIKNNGVASIPDLRDACMESGVEMLACQMTVDLFGYKQSDFIDKIEFGGAATYFEEASTATQSLYI